MLKRLIVTSSFAAMMVLSPLALSSAQAAPQRPTNPRPAAQRMHRQPPSAAASRVPAWLVPDKLEIEGSADNSGKKEITAKLVWEF